MLKDLYNIKNKPFQLWPKKGSDDGNSDLKLLKQIKENESLRQEDLEQKESDNLSNEQKI